MNILPFGPSREQEIRDAAGEPAKHIDAAQATDILQRRRKNCFSLQIALRWPYRDGRKPTPAQESEIRAAEWAYQCEVDALNLAIEALSEKTLTVEA